MQSLDPQKTPEKEKNNENREGFPCQSSSSPAKSNNIAASNTPTAAKKTTYLLVKKNGEAVKPTQVFKVVLKPQIPACIKATDVSSLLDQFLEYEQHQNTSATLVKESSVMLTPVSSPGHITTPKFTGLAGQTAKSATAQPNEQKHKSSVGLTPPVSPPSESTSPAIKTSSSASASLAKNLTFMTTPTKNPVSNTQTTRTNSAENVAGARKISTKLSGESNVNNAALIMSSKSSLRNSMANSSKSASLSSTLPAKTPNTLERKVKLSTPIVNTKPSAQTNTTNGKKVISFTSYMSKMASTAAKGTTQIQLTASKNTVSQSNKTNQDKTVDSPRRPTEISVSSMTVATSKVISQDSVKTVTDTAVQSSNLSGTSVKMYSPSRSKSLTANIKTEPQLASMNTPNTTKKPSNELPANSKKTELKTMTVDKKPETVVSNENNTGKKINFTKISTIDKNFNTKGTACHAVKNKEIKMEIDQPQKGDQYNAKKGEKLQEHNTIAKDYYPRKPESVQSLVYRIPKVKQSDTSDRKRRISTNDDDDDDKDDYDNYKRKKLAKDECYWTSSDEEYDHHKHRHRHQKQTTYYTKRRSSRDSSSDSNDDDDDRSYRRRYNHRKNERRHEQSRRSRSPHQSQRDDDRCRRFDRHKSERTEKKSPLKEDSKESNVHIYDIENERKKNFKLDRNIKETSTEKRKIVYIGNIEDSMTKATIWEKFRKFGPIEKTTVHYRNDGDNYAFVTFVDAASALEAIEDGKCDPDLKDLDICFGGRRKFCGGSYVDFDSTTSSFEEQQEVGARKSSSANEAMDFDTLLQMALKNKKRLHAV